MKIKQTKVNKAEEYIALVHFKEEYNPYRRGCAKPVAYACRTANNGIAFETVKSSPAVRKAIEIMNEICTTAPTRVQLAPFDYAVYYCGTAGNGAYANPMWIYCRNGEQPVMSENE